MVHQSKIGVSMEYNIDWDEVSYFSKKLLNGKMSADAMSQRVSRAVNKDQDKDLYLTLKLAQASAFYDSKVGVV